MSADAAELGRLPESARAAVLVAYDEPLQIQELPIPEVEPGALLVKVEVTTICGTDVHLSRGELTAEGKDVLPAIPGHETVGRVARIGAGAELDSVGNELKIGDRVIWEHAACGHCFACSVEMQPDMCANRTMYMWQPTTEFPYLAGGFAEYCYVYPRSGRVKVPDELKSEWAAAAACALRTVVKSMARLGKIETYERVVVQGVGPLGLFAVAIASRAGAKQVIAIGGPEQRRDLARSYGAGEVIPVEGTDPAARAEMIAELTEGHGADVVMEYSGAPGAFGEGLEFLHPGGRYVIVGQVGPQRETITPSLITKKQARIVGSYSATISQFWQALDWMRQAHRDVDFDGMISGRYALEDVNTALDRMADFSEIKAAVYPGEHGLAATAGAGR